MANLRKVIYINEEDYSTLINGDSLVIDGTTYTYEENALYVIKNAGPPEYAETAGYATNAGTSQVAVTDASGNNIAATYEKKSLVIEVNESDNETTLEQGTYDNITQALALGKLVILKVTLDEQDNDIIYLPLVYKASEANGNYYEFGKVDRLISYYASVNTANKFYWNADEISKNSLVVHKANTETITGNKTFTGTVALGSNATATTQATTDNDTSVATTAFVHNVVNAIPSTEQVQADWNLTTTTAKDYIKNKPNITKTSNGNWDFLNINEEIINLNTSYAAYYNNKEIAVKDDIPSEIITGQVVGRMHRDNVSGTGNLTITGASGEGFSPNRITTAGKYIVVVYSWSDTKTFGYNLSFGGNSYTLSTTDGTISDKRELTVSAGALWSGSVTTAVSAGTTIIVEIYKAEKTTPVLSVGTAALTNLYNDLDGKPTIPNDSNLVHKTGDETIFQNKTIGANGQIRLQSGWGQIYNEDDSESLQQALDKRNNLVASVNGQTGAVSLALGDANVIETISVNGTNQTITNKNVDISVPYTLTVHITESGNTYSADKTYAEIQTALNNGCVVLCDYGTDIFLYYGTANNKHHFHLNYLTGHLSQFTIHDDLIIISNSNKVTYEEYQRTGYNSFKTINSNTIIGTGDITIATPGTLDTTATTALSTNSSEALSGSITLHKVSKTGSYSDLIKPSTGIPKTDLASAVLTSLGKADTAIQSVKVNGTALTPDTNKAVDITVPTKTSDLTNDSGFITSGGDCKFFDLSDSINFYSIADVKDLVTGTLPANTYLTIANLLTSKYVVIKITNNNDEISELSYYLTTGNGSFDFASTTLRFNITIRIYDNDTWKLYYKRTENTIETIKVNGTALTPDSNKAVDITVPAAVTESTVSGWGFTKNAGTITGITMNGASKGTSGVVDLGTVLTSFTETDPTVQNWAKKAIGFGSSAYNGELMFANIFMNSWPSNGYVINLKNGENSAVTSIYTSSNIISNNGEIWNRADDYSLLTAKAIKDKIDIKYTKPSAGIPASDLADGVIPDEKLSSSYQTSTLENDNLLLAGGDTYETAFSKIEKAILDNEETIAASLNDLNTRKIEIDDVPTKISELINDAGYLTSFTEEDPVFSASAAAGISNSDITIWNDKVNRSGDTINGTLEIKPDGGGSALELNTTNQGSTAVLIEAGRGDSSNYHVITRDSNDNLIIGDTGHLVNLVTGSKVGNKTIATTDLIPTIPTNVSTFTNDAGYLTSFTETDPTVPAWAKATNKPTYTAAEVGALPDTYTPPVTSVNGQTGAVNLTIPSAPGTLNTTATTAQSTSSSEALSGNITLHKISKTGSYTDLIGRPTITSIEPSESSHLTDVPVWENMINAVPVYSTTGLYGGNNTTSDNYNDVTYYWDTAPTSGSTKAVTSGGVYTALLNNVNSTSVSSIVTLTEAQYEALSTKDSSTLYIITSS